MIPDDAFADDDDLVPLGIMMEAADRWRAAKAATRTVGGSEEWSAEVLRARDDIAAAMGARSHDDGPIDFVDAETMMATDYGETPWLCAGLITEKSVAVIGGEPKTAKTWAALEIAMAVTTGTPAFGEFATTGDAPRGAVVFLAEDNARSVRNRVRSLLQGRGPTPIDWAKRFVVKSLGAMDLGDLTQVARYVASVRALPFAPGVVVFDPLRDLHKKNEDNSGDMQPVYGALRALRTVLDCTVLFVHHSSKSSDTSSGRRGGQMLRGSSALHGAVDVGIYMTKPSKQRDEEASKTTMSCNVESEVKAAASVGDFGLALDVFDNANREAVRAQWVFQRATSGETPEAIAGMARDEGLVMAVLRQAHRQVPQGHPPIPKTGLALQAGGRKANMLAAIERLHQKGRIGFVNGPGGRALYRYLPGKEAEQAVAPATVTFEPVETDPADDIFGLES